MRRLVSFLVRNWPLKIAAVALATVLYGGLVLSENIRSFPGPVPIDIRNPPPDAAVLTAIDPIVDIRYRAPVDVASRLTSGSFHAWVDLSRVEPVPGGGEVRVGVEVIAVDQSVDIVDYDPKRVEILVDPLVTRQVPVNVDSGTVPGGLRVGPPAVEPRVVQVEGASTRVASVRTVTARVIIDASGINVDQEVEVVPLDQAGNLVAGVELTPDRVRVRIEVARQLAFASLPVIAEVIGDVAAGHRITSVAVDPLSITVSGEEAVVARLTAVRTEPIDISGRTGRLELDVPLAAPEDVTINTGSTAHVTIEIEPDEGSRTYEVGLTLAGIDERLVYDLPVPSVLVTLAGPIPLLDVLDVSAFPAIADVADLDPGRSTVPVQVVPPDGTELVTVQPEEVTIEVSEPEPTPTVVAPTVAPSPTPEP